MVKEKLTWQNCTTFVSDHRSVYIQFFKFCQSCQQNVQTTYCKSKVKHFLFVPYELKNPLGQFGISLKKLNPFNIYFKDLYLSSGNIYLLLVFPLHFCVSQTSTRDFYHAQKSSTNSLNVLV